MKRFAIVLALVLAGAGCDEGQQGDRSFQPRVERPAYTDSHPTVLYEDGHKTPHTSKDKYRAFVELLRTDGYSVRSHQGEFTPSALEKARVLVIVNAGGTEKAGEHFPSFTAKECEVIEAWVRGGGSLLLVADHAPYGLYAAGLARRVGVTMSGGTTADSLHMDPTGHDETQFLFGVPGLPLGSHPILSGRDERERVGRVRTYTGQTLVPPPGATALLPFASTAQDWTLPTGEKLVRARKAGRVVFEGPFPTPPGACQGLAMDHGKGRVVVLGEAAMLTAQRRKQERWGLTEPGADNQQFALNVAHWLSRLLP